MSDPKISIIIPMYNAQDYIVALLDCIIAQTEKSFEVLLCDDGSTDNTVRICQDYAKRDQRFRVIRNLHQGVSQSRNSGIAASSGIWITFIDCDDRISSTYLSSLLQGAINDSIDLVCCGYAVISGNKTDVVTYIDNAYSDREQYKLLCKTKFLYRCSPWAKLFKKKIIIENNIRFNINLSHSEDRLFFYEYLLYTNGIYTTSSIGYFYGSFDSNSLKNRPLSIDTVKKRQLLLTNATNKLIKKHNVLDCDVYMFQIHLFKLLINAIQTVYKNYGMSKTTVEIQKEIINKYFDFKLHNDALNDVRYKNFSSQKTSTYILENKLNKLNSNLFLHDINLTFRIFIYKLLKRKSPKMTYDNAITIVNTNYF